MEQYWSWWCIACSHMRCQQEGSVSVRLHLTFLDIRLKVRCWRSSMTLSHQRVIDRRLFCYHWTFRPYSTPLITTSSVKVLVLMSESAAVHLAGFVLSSRVGRSTSPSIPNINHQPTVHLACHGQLSFHVDDQKRVGWDGLDMLNEKMIMTGSNVV